MKPHVFIAGRCDVSKARIESDEVDLALAGFVVTRAISEAHAAYCPRFSFYADADERAARIHGLPVYYSVKSLVESFTWPFPTTQKD